MKNLYMYGDVETVSSGVWTVETLKVGGELDPGDYVSEVTSQKLHVETYLTGVYYQVMASWNGILDTDPGEGFRVVVKVDAVSETAFVQGVVVGLDLCGYDIRFYAPGVYTYTEGVDFYATSFPSTIGVKVADISLSPQPRNITIDYIKIYVRTPASTPFFEEEFESFYTHPTAGVGDVPTGWQGLIYGTSTYGLKGTGYHEGGAPTVGTVAPLVFNELTDSFNGIYTF